MMLWALSQRPRDFWTSIFGIYTNGRNGELSIQMMKIVKERMNLFSSNKHETFVHTVRAHYIVPSNFHSAFFSLSSKSERRKYYQWWWQSCGRVWLQMKPSVRHRSFRSRLTVQSQNKQTGWLTAAQHQPRAASLRSMWYGISSNDVIAIGQGKRDPWEINLLCASRVSVYLWRNSCCIATWRREWSTIRSGVMSSPVR